MGLDHGLVLWDKEFKYQLDKLPEGQPTYEAYETCKLCKITWRKINAAHGWFIKNIPDAVDNGEFEVSLEQVAGFVTSAMKIVDAHRASPFSDETKRLAMELVPPTSGFFFGSTDLDQYYFDDLEHAALGAARLVAIAVDSMPLRTTATYWSWW